MHDSNVVGIVADVVHQNSSSEKEITRRHADVIIPYVPSVSYNLYLFPLVSSKSLHGHSTRTDGSTIESTEKKKIYCLPLLPLCSEEVSVPRLLCYHLSCWKAMLYCLHVCCFQEVRGQVTKKCVGHFAKGH